MGDVYMEAVYKGNIYQEDVYKLEGDVHQRGENAEKSSEGRRYDSPARLGHRATKSWP